MPSAQAQRVAEVPALHRIDYGSFVWLELAPEQLAELTRRGVPFERERDPAPLEIQGHVVGLPERGLRAGAAADGSPDPVGFRLLQLIGPAKAAWVDRLGEVGLEIVQFVAPNGYLVRGSAGAAERASGLEFVRSVDAYRPEYRTSAELLAREGRIENVDVGIHVDGIVATVAAIEALGGVETQRDLVPHDGRIANVTFVLDSTALHAIARLSDVAWLAYRQPSDPSSDEVSSQIVAGNVGPTIEPGYRAWLDANGLHGDGVTLGLIDTGYDSGVDSTSHPDLSGRLDFVEDLEDRDGHGTHVGGIIAGDARLGVTDANGHLLGLGVAPGASLVVRQKEGPDSLRTRDVVTRGAVAANNSYGIHPPGVGYTSRDRSWDFFVRDADPSTEVAEPLTIVFAAGNLRRSGVTVEAKNVIAVASTNNPRARDGAPSADDIDAVAESSSRGPAGDGRVYPHVAAPGENVTSTRSTRDRVVVCDRVASGAEAPATDPTYSMCAGTSMAAPQVTGAIGLLTEWWRSRNAGANPSPAMAKALLVNGAVDIGVPDIPNRNEGWGRIDVGRVVQTEVPTRYVDQGVLFTDTGQTWVARMFAWDPDRPVKLSLAWTDTPGPGTGGNPAALVNDLDLIVTHASARYVGNDFADGVSTTGGSPDRVDNLENVFLARDTHDPITLEVVAAALNGDGVPFNGDPTDQDWALVARNVADALVHVVDVVEAGQDPVAEAIEVAFDVDDDGEPPGLPDESGAVRFPVAAGTYDVLALAPPMGSGLWRVTASCVDDADGTTRVGVGSHDAPLGPRLPDVAVRHVDLDPGESVTCTFVREPARPFPPGRALGVRCDPPRAGPPRGLGKRPRGHVHASHPRECAHPSGRARGLGSGRRGSGYPRGRGRGGPHP